MKLKFVNVYTKSKYVHWKCKKLKIQNPGILQIVQMKIIFFCIFEKQVLNYFFRTSITWFIYGTPSFVLWRIGNELKVTFIWSIIFCAWYSTKICCVQYNTSECSRILIWKKEEIKTITITIERDSMQIKNDSFSSYIL